MFLSPRLVTVVFYIVNKFVNEFLLELLLGLLEIGLVEVLLYLFCNNFYVTLGLFDNSEKFSIKLEKNS